MTRSRTLTAAAVSFAVLTSAVAGPGSISAGEPPADTERAAAEGRLTWPTPRRTPSSSRRQFVLDAPLLSDAPGAQLYQVRLIDDPLLGYTGGVPGLAPTAGPAAASDGGAARAERAYLEHLAAAQTAAVDSIGAAVGHAVAPLAAMRYGDNMVVLRLTRAEALAVSKLPGVIAVAPLPERVALTDTSPELVRADDVWVRDPDGAGALTHAKGDGMVIGVIDTGVSPYNPSFAPTPGMQNPLGAGNYLGVCAGTRWDPDWGPFPCNEKLIGMYSWPADGDGSGIDTAGFDLNGHGSHTASAAAGAPVTAHAYDLDLAITGIAPNASIVMYGGCCFAGGLDLVPAIDQAAQDAAAGLLDVINYSVGAEGPGDPYTDFDAVAFYYIRLIADTFVAVSNMNEGPEYFTAGSPATAPWVTSVAATATARSFRTDVAVTDGGDTHLLAAAVMADPLGPKGIATWDEGDRLCDDPGNHTASYSGKVVVCERGTTSFVQKAVHVLSNGGVGMIVVNAGPSMSDPDAAIPIDLPIPGFMISNNQGQALYAFLDGHPSAEVSWATSVHTDDPGRVDMIGEFSSRGPNLAVDVVNPSLSAPGVDILAAVTDPDDPTHAVWGAMSGTSMASPHVAGAALLLRQLHPDWTAAEVQSALMTTAVPSVTDLDTAHADIYTQGSGRLDIGRAADAGLLFDIDPGDFAWIAERDLNLPSFADSQCVLTCAWTRVAANVDPSVTWTAGVTIEGDPALGVDVDLDASVPGLLGIHVTADVTGIAVGYSGEARITLTPSDAAVPAVTMPLGVFSAAAQLPPSVSVDTRRDAGSVTFDVVSVPVTEFTATMFGLAEADIVDGELPHDPTPGEPFDVAAGGVAVHPVTVPSGTDRLVVEVLDTTINDLDLFVGTGATPSVATTVCVAASAGSSERCTIDLPAAGTWWVAVQNWAAGGPRDTYSIAIGVVAGSPAGNARVTSTASPGATGYAVTVAYDLAANPGSVWYGTLELGSAPGAPGDLGYVPFTLRRHAGDVTVAASASVAEPGDSITYTVTIATNVTGRDATYDVSAAVPDGLVVAPASITGGGLTTGRTVVWDDVAVVDGGSPVVLRYTASVAADAPAGSATTTFTHVPDDPFAVAQQATVDVVIDAVDAPLLQPVPPKRLFDTRPTEPQGAIEIAQRMYGGDDVLRVDLLGVAGIGERSVAAVALNVTAVEPAGPGYVTVYPCNAARPHVSNINFPGPGVYPNAVVVPVSADGELCLYSKVATHLIADVVGWFPEGAGVGTVTPTRLFDTRATEPDGVVPVATSPVGGEQQILRVRIADVAGVPAGAAAVALNVTAVDPVAAGYVTVYPCSAARPRVSNVNYSGPGVYPNAVIAPVSAAGEVCFYSKVPTDLIADVSAWFPVGPDFGAVTPTRLFDTRLTEPHGAIEVTKQRYSGDDNVVRVRVTGTGGVPSEGVGMVALNVTAVDPAGPGYVTVYPCGARPVVSNVNFGGPGVYPNAVITPVSDAGEVCFYSKVPTDLIADVNGWFAAP